MQSFRTCSKEAKKEVEKEVEKAGEVEKEVERIRIRTWRRGCAGRTEQITVARCLSE